MNILKKIRAKQADLFAPPVAIAFLGDSVTQGCFEVYLTSEGAVQTVFEPESGYAADVRKLFALLYPGVPVQFINAGISGDNAPSGLQRLERDVLAYHPDLTVVCFGLNDACRGDETQEEYASALDGIFTKLKEAGSEIIFMTPNMMNTRLSEKLTVPEIRAVAEPYIRARAIRHLEKGRVVIFGCGTGNPFFSTDTGAVLRAAEIGADAILLAKNIDGVYSADPAKDPTAVKYDAITYDEVLARHLAVMDTTATSLSMDNHIPVQVFALKDPQNILRVVMGEPIGTIVKEEL